MKGLNFLLAITLALVCLSSCGSDDDNGIDGSVTKRIKSVNDSNYYTANFSYDGDKISKITVKSSTGETLTMSYEYQTGKIIEKVTNDYFDGNANYTNTITLSNGLATSIQYKQNSNVIEIEYSNGYMTKYGDEYVYRYDNKGNMVSSPNYTNLTPSDTENKGQIWMMSLYDHNPRDLRFYLGVFGKPSTYLPSNGLYQGAADVFSYNLDKDGYVKEVKGQSDDGSKWTETYTYEAIQ